MRLLSIMQGVLITKTAQRNHGSYFIRNQESFIIYDFVLQKVKKSEFDDVVVRTERSQYSQGPIFPSAVRPSQVSKNFITWRWTKLAHFLFFGLRPMNVSVEMISMAKYG